MGFLSGYRKKRELAPEHKFEYINLRDFKDKSFVNVTAYIWIYLSILISLSCVAADTYTAITLLVFNRWSSQIQPVIPFETAKIVFAVCILISYVLIVYDWVFALKVIRRGGVADAYMNVIALRWNSVWGGNDKDDTGWRRFLVFARLTEQRGKTDYVALITYFSFKGWVRVVFAEGPRVVINAFTLASVVSANLLPKKETEGLSAISKFFENIQHLYSENKIQVIVLGSMTFTTALWIFAILQLLLACILFLTFLWHVMNGDSLRKYCKDRIDRRMGEIVLDNHKKVIRKDNKEKSQAGILRAPTIPAAALMEKPSYAPSMMSSPVSNSPSSLRVQQLPRQPTLPNLADIGSRRGTPKPLQRIQTSSSTTSSVRPPMSRSQTNMSGSSYDSILPLVSAQANTGYGGQGFGRGSQESQEYIERQQQVQRQWGSPPPLPASAYGYAGSINGRSEGSRTPAPAYASSNSSRGDGRRTPAPRDAPGYQIQDLHPPSSQTERGPFIPDRQQMQDGYAEMPPMSGQGQYQEQNGQYQQRPSSGRSRSGRSGYGPAQGRFPIAVRTREQQQSALTRFPIAVGPREPQQQQQQQQYYSESPIEQMQSLQDYYPPRQQTPRRQQILQQLQEPPQPYAYEYVSPRLQREQEETYQQQAKPQSQLPRLNTQTPSPETGGGYKRPAYSPAPAATNNSGQSFDETPASYFPSRENQVQARSATTPPVRAIQQPQRSTTVRPDLGMRRPTEYEQIQQPVRSATTRPEDSSRREM